MNHDVNLYAPLLNLLAALMYLVDSIGAITIYTGNPGTGNGRYIYTAPKSWNFPLAYIADVIYLLDSFYYVAAWYRDMLDVAEDEARDLEASRLAAIEDATGLNDTEEL